MTNLPAAAFWVGVILLVCLSLWCGFRLLVALAGVLLEGRGRDGW